MFGVTQTNIVDSDAARHAMNGAFLYDLVRTGHVLHPIAYAWSYYSQLPALSMPFHPPLFPAIEAGFYAIFGVNLFAARLAVAICVGISAFLLYRLVLATFHRASIAAAVTVTAFSSWTLQFVARDVMLEFPALVFTLAALYCLRDIAKSYPMRRAIPFALFAGAAVWTKQHAVFLGLVPFVDLVLARRWRTFRQPWLWISSALFGAEVIALVAISRRFHGAGADQLSTSTSAIYYILTSTLPSYFQWITGDLLGLPGLLLLGVAAVSVWNWRKHDAQAPSMSLYWAWVLAVFAVLIDLGPIARRYLFFVLPAVSAIMYGWLFYGTRRLLGEKRAQWLVGAFALAFFLSGLRAPFDYLHGPAEAAQLVVNGKPERVLYAGDGDGNFIFAVRSLDSKMQTTVIPAIKLPAKFWESGDIGALCRRYNINWVVFENTPRCASLVRVQRLASSGRYPGTVDSAAFHAIPVARGIG